MWSGVTKSSITVELRRVIWKNIAIPTSIIDKKFRKESI